MFEKMRADLNNFKWVWIFNGSSLVFLITAHVLNVYRAELFHVDHRSAGQNFSFNFFYFIPMHLASFVSLGFGIFRYFYAIFSIKKMNRKPTWREKLSIVPGIPGLLSILFVGGWIVSICLDSK